MGDADSCAMSMHAERRGGTLSIVASIWERRMERGAGMPGMRDWGLGTGDGYCWACLRACMRVASPMLPPVSRSQMYR